MMAFAWIGKSNSPAVDARQPWLINDDDVFEQRILGGGAFVERLSMEPGQVGHRRRALREGQGDILDLLNLPSSGQQYFV